MSVRVWRSRQDWEVECAEHLGYATASDWLCAMEAAWGHIAMWHPRPPCEHEYGWHPAGRPEEHQCLDCGTPLPVAVQ